MELLRIVRRRSFLSEVIYVGLNIALVAAIVIAIRVTNSPWPAFGLILLSKWRVLAVRPRFWFVNIQANLVDLIVGLSFVVLMYTGYESDTSSTQNSVILAGLAILYVCWLLFLKPRSKRGYVIAQAAAALFLGVTALYTVSFDWIASVVVIGMWLIGYATARHILSHYEESHIFFLSLVWGLFMAEIAWPAYHWTIAYGFLPQVSIVTLGIGFLAFKAYDSFMRYDRIRTNDIILPMLLTVSVVIVLILFFNNVSTGSI
jgi:hypothetical protein